MPLSRAAVMWGQEFYASRGPVPPKFFDPKPSVPSKTKPKVKPQRSTSKVEARIQEDPQPQDYAPPCDIWKKSASASTPEPQEAQLSGDPGDDRVVSDPGLLAAGHPVLSLLTALRDNALPLPPPEPQSRSFGRWYDPMPALHQTESSLRDEVTELQSQLAALKLTNAKEIDEMKEKWKRLQLENEDLKHAYETRFVNQPYQAEERYEERNF